MPRKTTEVVEKAGVMAVGANQYEGSIPLTVVKEAGLREDITAVKDGIVAVDTAKKELVVREAAVRALITLIRLYLTMVRDHLKLTLGFKKNQGWEAAGFIRSLMVPNSESELVQMLGRLKGFLGANAALELPVKEITAVKVEAYLTQLEAARGAVNLQEKMVKDMLADRKTKAAALLKSMRNLLAELKGRLTPLDSRWLAFGLNMPGAEPTPQSPTNVAVTLLGSTAMSVKWAKSAYADYYRVWVKVVGVDEQPVNVGNSNKLDFTIQPLTPGVQMEISLSAVSTGGESLKSDVVTVATPK